MTNHDLTQVSPVTKSGAVTYNMTALMTAQTNNLTHVVKKWEVFFPSVVDVKYQGKSWNSGKKWH